MNLDDIWYLCFTFHASCFYEHVDCYFCQKGIEEINFNDTELLKKFISGLAKIRARKRTGVCSRHQRKLAKAIKRARHLGLLPVAIK